MATAATEAGTASDPAPLLFKMTTVPVGADVEEAAGSDELLATMFSPFTPVVKKGASAELELGLELELEYALAMVLLGDLEVVLPGSRTTEYGGVWGL